MARGFIQSACGGVGTHPIFLAYYLSGIQSLNVCALPIEVDNNQDNQITNSPKLGYGCRLCFGPSSLQSHASPCISSSSLDLCGYSCYWWAVL